MFFTDLFETPDEKESEKWERAGVAAGGTAGGLSAGQAALTAKPSMKPGELARSVASGALRGTIPALALTSTGKQAYDYAKQGKYGQAAIAAGSGLLGAATLNPIGATAIPLAGSAINACIDDPESCKELGGAVGELLTGKNDQPRLFQQQPKITPSEFTTRRLEKKLTNTNENTERSFNVADANLISAIKDVESGNNPAAVSPKGALGTMQVMPPTAKDPGFGVKPANNFSSSELERVGQDYFNAMLNKYGGDKRLALIAYNMGPNATDKWLSKGADPTRLPKETQGYVPKVLNKYQQSNTSLPTQPVNPKPLSNLRTNRAAVRPVVSPPMITVQDPARVPYTYTAPSGQTVSNYRTLNPNWTPPPGPKVTPRPNPQDIDKIIKQKDRPKSIDDIINKAKKKEISQSEIKNLANSLASSTDSQDLEMSNMLQKISADTNIAEQTNQPHTINESYDRLTSKIYDILEIQYGDLVKLYGHEVVGDAIRDVVLQSENDPKQDLNTLSRSVLQLLRKRLEEQLKETIDSESDNNNESDFDSKEHHNAVIQIQADLDKIKNTLDIKENKIYFNIVATSDYDLKYKFGLRKDHKGWYLHENADPSLKLDAVRTFSIL